MKVILCTCLIAFGSLGADRTGEKISPLATKVSWDFAPWCQVGDHRFTFEKTNLGDIMQALGAGKLTRNGDAGAAVFEWQVRYRLGNEVVTFMSNNDMGGVLHDLETVEIKPVDKDSNSSLPIIHGPIAFPIGKLGMSFPSLQHQLGLAKIDQKYAEFLYAGHKRGMAEGKAVEFDVQGWLRVKVVDGNVEQMTVNHLTSY